MASGNYSDVDVSEPSMSSEEENSSEKPFSSARHPFSVRDSKPILMNIRVSCSFHYSGTLDWCIMTGLPPYSINDIYVPFSWSVYIDIQ